ncbi:hypothetical protein GCM10007116_05230 [Sulfodiicoccus acidiphilus]|nr:hypothetical protein GCM10007116_05230 [Sulfodiicoccus acidiphilus]
MKAGFLFSTGFTAQRALLTTLGFVGLAAFYQRYNLDGPVYIVVGVVMAVAGSYVLKGRYIHLPVDKLLGGNPHHTSSASRVSEDMAHNREVPLKMTVLHGLIAGFGFGAYATIVTFVLAPQVPSVVYAPLPGAMFGLGTMSMQILFGAAFANLARIKKLTQEEISIIGRSTAGRTLYYGGIAFMFIGLLIVAFPLLDQLSISTGNPIPNLDAVNVGFVLVVSVVGVIGVGSLVKSYMDMTSIKRNRKSYSLPKQT